MLMTGRYPSRTGFAYTPMPPSMGRAISIVAADTGFNPFGLCGVATAEKAISKIIALPNPAKGSIKVLNYGK